MKINRIVIALISILLTNCIMEEKQEPFIDAVPEKMNWKRKKGSIENSILEMTVKAHGGNFYDSAAYSFLFRSKRYSFIHNNSDWEYRLMVKTDSSYYEDVLKSNIFSRKDSSGYMRLLTDDSLKYAASLNSVLYFATLPYKLQDAAVRKQIIGTDSIRDQNYYALEITFDEKGGGKDYDDIFLYWINTRSYTIDYFAYHYHTNGGGVRFREAYNRRLIGGIIFQDYINYKAAPHTSLKELPKLFAVDSLHELSRIEIEDIQAI